MTLHVYVAGGSTEVERCRSFIAAVRAIPGVDVTMDWVAFMDASGAADHELGIERLIEGARADLRGVLDADVVVVLPPASPSRGAQTELGVAIAAMKHTIAVGDLDAPVVARGLGLFGVLVNDWLGSDADALVYLRGFASRVA